VEGGRVAAAARGGDVAAVRKRMCEVVRWTRWGGGEVRGKGGSVRGEGVASVGWQR